MQPGVVFFDVISLVAFSAAFVLVVREPFDEYRPYSRAVRTFLSLALFVYVFVSLSNVLEHAGITAALDEYEDYAEILFIPLVAYALYSMQNARVFHKARRASELLEAEHGLLMSIVDTSPSGIMFVTPTGGIGFANDAARTLLRLEELPDGGMKMPEDLVCQSTDVASARPLSVESLAEGRSFRGAGCVVETGGEKVVLSVSASALGMDRGSGQARGSVAAFTDVTEREMARQELLNAQARYSFDLERTVDERTVELLAANRALESANKMKHDFVATVSHELKTPLAAIQGFTSMLLRELPGPLNAEQSKQLGLVRDSSEQLVTLVERLLEFEKIETGYAVATPTPVSVLAAATRVVELIGPLAAERRVMLRIESADDFIAETDEGLLGQILRNLVSNAVKFTPGEGTVSLRIGAEGDHVRVAVIDTGVGIDPADHERIFEPFARVEMPDESRPEGTGLGLSISRELAMALGGSISIVSALGEGSTFTLEIPLVFPRD